MCEMCEQIISQKNLFFHKGSSTISPASYGKAGILEHNCTLFIHSEYFLWKC
jgi:hypothetical protein